MRGQDLKRQKQTSAGRGQEKTRGKMTKEKKKGKSKVNLSLKQEEEVRAEEFILLWEIFVNLLTFSISFLNKKKHFEFN